MTCAGRVLANQKKLDEVLDLRLSFCKAKQNEQHASL